MLGDCTLGVGHTTSVVGHHYAGGMHERGSQQQADGWFASPPSRPPHPRIATLVKHTYLWKSATHLCGDEGVDAVCVHAGDTIVSVVPDMHGVAAVDQTLLECFDAVRGCKADVRKCVSLHETIWLQCLLIGQAEIVFHLKKTSDDFCDLSRMHRNRHDAVHAEASCSRPLASNE